MSSTTDTQRWWNDIHQGDVLETLAKMPESSVHCVVTSPPYFGLRDYDTDGQIGLEETLDEYLNTLVEVGEAIRRVLRDDGVWWLNLGDSYASKPRGNTDPLASTGLNNNAESFDAQDAGRDTTGTFRQKQKMLVPHRVAIALQESGWFVRDDGVWAKPNPMPDSVKDRLNEQKEFLFQLTPSAHYWWDLDAIREPHADSTFSRTEYSYEAAKDAEYGDDTFDRPAHPNGKNPGDVFEVSVKPFPEAHFAVYPPDLVRPLIKSSCPPKVCAACGTPYERVTESVPPWERNRSTIERAQTRRALEIADEEGLTTEHFEAARAVGLGNLDRSEGNPYDRVDEETAALAREAADVLGSYYREALMSESRPTDEWDQVCDCPVVGEYTEPGIVLDPFAGAGTTCLVAKELGRRFVGIELNPEYVALAQRRVGVTVDEPERLLEDGEASLTAFADGGDLGE